MINYKKYYLLLMFVNVIVLIVFVGDIFFKIERIDDYKHKLTNQIINQYPTTKQKKLTGTQTEIFSSAKEYQLQFIKWEDQAWIFTGKYQNLKKMLLKLTTFSAFQIVKFSIEQSPHNNLILQVVLCYV